MKTISAHELAAMLATLIMQPEALGCVMADDEYELLLGDAGQLLARHWGVRVEEVLSPDLSGGPFGLRVALPSSDAGEGSFVSTTIPDFDALRGSAATILRSLAERIR